MAVSDVHTIVGSIIGVIRWLLLAFVWILRFIIDVMIWSIKAIPWLILFCIVIIAAYFGYQFALKFGNKFHKKDKEVLHMEEQTTQALVDEAPKEEEAKEAPKEEEPKELKEEEFDAIRGKSRGLGF